MEKFEGQGKISKRYHANCEIINKLLAIATAHPDWRFHQILQNCKINLPDAPYNVATGTLHMIDLWYEESADTLERVRESYNQFVINQYHEDKSGEIKATTGSATGDQGS